MVGRRQDDGHTIMDGGDQLVRLTGGDGECAHQFTGRPVGVLFPDSGHGEGLVRLHGDGIGLLFLARCVELMPFEIAVDGHQAAA